MTFFYSAVNAVAHHWFLSLVYVVLVARIVWRFRNEVVLCSYWSHRLRGRLFSRWDSKLRRAVGNIVWGFLVLLLTLLLFLPVTPILWFFLRQRDTRERRRQEADQAERHHVAAERKRRENNERAQRRKQWLTENQPKLFFNTVSGITAVLRPADYETIRKQTNKARRDGFWEKENILLPARDTFIFVTKQGGELVETNGGDRARRYKVAGPLSQLDEIAEMGDGVQLERKEDIFVPWVNETVCSFDGQLGQLQDCVHRGAYYYLIEMQAPRDLQPLPDY